jgi:hypothetical protein
MHATGLRFSIARHAAWAPGVTSAAQWQAWARDPLPIVAGADPAVAAMPAMLRRRAGPLGKMALEVAYQCLGERRDVPTVFSSRHGEAVRAVSLLDELARDGQVSPTGFSLAVHNASAGLFSIARADRANHIALAAGAATMEHAVIEACGLLADGAPEVLLVAYDCALPAVLAQFEECQEQSFAFAWLMVPAANDAVQLSWRCAEDAPLAAMPGALEVLRFQLGGAARLERVAERKRWIWSRCA